MRVTRLKLTNVRAIRAAELRFGPGLNLVTGVNGAGKTTVLDSLGTCLASFVSRNQQGRRGPRGRPTAADVGPAGDTLQVECELAHSGATYRCTHRRARSGASRGPDWRRTSDGGNLAGGEAWGPAVAVLFTTDRATASRTRTGRKGPANAAAFAAGELRLREDAAWMETLEARGPAEPGRGSVLDTLDDAMARLLPGCGKVRPDEATGTDLVAGHSGATLPVRQLSEGERGILGIVLELSRRLATAYPETRNPAAEAEAVVLIEELELHLHPQRQRELARELPRAFPRCQFIATTLSPQVIGEVEHERVHVVTADRAHSPARSFGLDSNRVLEEIMQTGTRSAAVGDLIAAISRDAREKRVSSAREAVERLADRLGENDPDVTHLRTLVDLLERDD